MCAKDLVRDNVIRSKLFPNGASKEPYRIQKGRCFPKRQVIGARVCKVYVHSLWCCAVPQRSDSFGAECSLNVPASGSPKFMNSAGRTLLACLLFCLCTAVILWTPAGSLSNHNRSFLILLSSSSIVLKLSTLQTCLAILTEKKNLSSLALVTTGRNGKTHVCCLFLQPFLPPQASVFIKT